MIPRLIGSSVLSAGLVIAFLKPALAIDTAGTEPVAQIVAEALRAEVAGDAEQRARLLRRAIEAAPDYSAARWHSGQVFANGAWQPLDVAQEAAAADPNRPEYRALKEAGGASLDGQLLLARWCRKHGLDDEARFHWRTVLSHEPNNEEALRAIGARWFGGQLQSYAEIDAAKARTRAANRAAKMNAPQVAKWKRLLAAGDIRSRDEALGEIRALESPGAISALENLTLGTRLTNHTRFERTMQMSLALVAAMDNMANKAATESLLRHAALSPIADVRAAAIAALKKRPPHDYVPHLLGALQMPVESTFRVATDSDGSVHYWHSLYREGINADWAAEARQSAMQHDLHGPTDVTIDDRVRDELREFRLGAGTNPAVNAEIALVASHNRQRFGITALTAQQQIATMNQTTESANRLIYPVLAATTGQDFGENLRAWWDWWDDYNEYSADGETPVYEHHVAESTHRYYRPPQESQYTILPPLPPPGRYSCFAKGTPVLTKTGPQPIETLEIGDLVLAQHPDTGELAYKPVVGRTVRPPSRTLILSLDEEELQTTLGHPLWVAGVGWRMAKELGDGAILHSVHGPVRVNAIADADEIEAYNLIVADFNTYFVGECGVLVHDNTPRDPTTAIVPGLTAE